MSYSEEQLKRIYADLPQDIQEAMFSVATAKTITEVSGSFGLHVDQTGKIAEETGFVMLGLTHPDHFEYKLSKRLPELNSKVLSSIVNQINEKVFSRIKNSMEKIHSEHKGDNHEDRVTKTEEDTDKIFEERMSKLFNLPQKKTDEEKKEPELPKYEKQDPYLEPLE